MILMAIPMAVPRHPITRTHIIAVVDGHRQMVEALLMPVYRHQPKHHRGAVAAGILQVEMILMATIHTAKEEVVLLAATVATVEIRTITIDIPVVVQTTVGNTVAMVHLPLIMVEVALIIHIIAAEVNRRSRLCPDQEHQVQDQQLRLTLHLRIIAYEVLAAPTHTGTLEEIHPPMVKERIRPTTKTTV
jgi:hypothetical protein